MDAQRVGDLEVSQDLPFEHRSWQVQRVGWAVFVLVLAGGVLGVFGGAGPLERATVGEGSGLEVEYSRFARHNAPTDMFVRLQPPAGSRGGEVRLWVESAYLELVRIERIQPGPERVEVHADRVTWGFALDPGQPGTVVFHLEPQRAGWHTVRMGVDGGPEHPFTQVIYP